MRLIPEHYLDAVVAIGVPNPHDETQTYWIGTGFFVKYPRGRRGDETLFLITNKHVVRGKQAVRVRVNGPGLFDDDDSDDDSDSFKEDDADTIVQDITIPLVTEWGRPCYAMHPTFNFDIVAIGISWKKSKDFRYLTDSWFDLADEALSLEEMNFRDVAEGDTIFTCGYPMGQVDDFFMLPFCRQGCISRIIDVFLFPNSSFFVDAQIFPGNSGGPIINRPDPQRLAKPYLLGIVSHYLVGPENALRLSPDEIIPLPSENSGLAVVFSVDCIQEIVRKWEAFGGEPVSPQRLSTASTTIF